jgi:hypothetical protein
MPASKLRHSDVLGFVELTSGSFNIQQIKEYLNIVTPEGRNNLYVILNRMVKAGTIAPTAITGTYRKVDTDLKSIDWENADINANIPIQLPFNLHTLCKVYPKSIIIVAGSKNEGKTAFLMQCIKLNFDLFHIDFYNSETGAEQLRMRFDAMYMPKPAPFATWERYDAFADVIHPEHLSIIDYLDLNAELYMVGEEIDKIFRKLTTGCAIIGLQKPPPAVTYLRGVKKVIDRDLAYGGGFTAKRAVIYVSLSNHRLKLVYCKTPMNPKVNPNNKQWSYNFDDNGFFKDINEYEEVTYDDV